MYYNISDWQLNMKIKCIVCCTTKLVTHVSIVFYNAINTVVCSLDTGSGIGHCQYSSRSVSNGVQ